MGKYTVRETIPDTVQKTFETYPELLRELLYYRGIETKDDAESFLSPDYDRHLHDPFLLKDMDRATVRIIEALKNNEKILIYSDYDMDGGPGGVILHDFFKKIGYQNFQNYIPHRHKEGYGLNTPAVEQFASDGVRLVITVDCGISDVGHVARGNELGLDIIITDHHLPGKVLPSAYAIINPKQEDDSYPFDGLCGSGVVFKLVQALLKKFETSDFKPEIPIAPGWEKWLLDMVGLATIADMVPLRGENRVLAYYGLKVLRKSRRPGLQKLCRKMRLDQRYLTEDDVGFMIGPRINAASRMGEAMDAFRLLSTEDPVLAGQLADHLDHMNNERKGVVASMAREIKKRIRVGGKLGGVLVMGDPRWRPALLGLAANSLVEEYKRPVFLWGREGGGNIKGSCRSDGSVDVVELMGHAKDVLLEFGGHENAGGFSVSHEMIHRLEEELIASYAVVKNGNKSKETTYVDRVLTLSDVSWKTYNLFEQLAPFGEGNPKPLFLFKNLTLGGMRMFGKSNNHLELSFDKENGGKVLAIGFFMKPDQFDKKLAEGEHIDLVATMERSRFRNYPELRLRIVDVV